MLGSSVLRLAAVGVAAFCSAAFASSLAFILLRPLYLAASSLQPLLLRQIAAYFADFAAFAAKPAHSARRFAFLEATA